ncbi:nucleosome positioning [Halocaridina rubra]|uniref:Nucleosome positioning n=1 Tax=Halocaridina rubra TaxID=373956 RepID=A0AAN8WA75_HALRR
MSEDDAKADGAEESSGERDESGGEAGGVGGSKRRKRGPAKGSKRGTGTKRKPTKRMHPKTTDMIVEAIENLGDKRGSSYQAIKAYILQNFSTVRADMVRSMMRRALKTGLEQSIFVRPKGHTSSHGMSGRYLLGKEAHLGEELEVMPQKSKRALAVAALKAKKTKKGGKKKKAKRPVAKKARR